MAKTIDLTGTWSWAISEKACLNACSLADLESQGLSIRPCQVPGCLETDLHAAGLIGDPFVGLNILEVQAYEEHHVYYALSFEVDAADRDAEAHLVFEGLDCFADIWLNGEQVGSAANMLVEHRFPVTGRLREHNELFVHIRPAVIEARRHDYPTGLRTKRVNYEGLRVRKAPHMFGWDIMPRAVSAGIWRPVRIEFLPEARLKSLHLETLSIAEDKSVATLMLFYDLDIPSVSKSRYMLELNGRCGGSCTSVSQEVGFRAGCVEISVDSPCLWWPRGSGSAELYGIEVTLLCDGEPVDTRRFKHGIRQVQLVRTDVTDKDGSGEFYFRVNGEKIFIKGTNWVPADAFHWRDRERLPQILPMLEDLHCNMVRCWGGNVYEDDFFYDWCDEHGIMVWQDFAMACALYPQDEAFQRVLEDEARQVVRRLRQHPCIVLWAGDNECDEAREWQQGGDPGRNALTRQVLPGVLVEEDPARPYLPSSPYIAEATYMAGGVSHAPEMHLWGPRGYFKSAYYTEAWCHFVSEIGYHGCPSVESLRKFLSPDKVWPPQDNDEWMLHSTNPCLDTAIFAPKDYRVNLMLNQVRELFGSVPEGLEDFVFASQATQAEAKKYFIERFRMTKWRRTGILWWNLMDGWPQLSDAVVDYYFEKKLAYHYIRRSQQDICLMLSEPEHGRQELIVANDTLREHELSFTVTDLGLGEEILAGKARVVANTSQVAGELPCGDSRQTMYLIQWKCAEGEGANHYLCGKPPFDLSQYKQWLKRSQL